MRNGSTLSFPETESALKSYNPEEASVFFAGNKVYAPEGLPTNINKTGEKTMMQRRTVTVELYDDDKGLPVEQSLVARCSNVVTEDNDEVTIREVLMGGLIKEKLEAHNNKRVKVINEEILNRTGQEVPLRPIKLKDLRWVVK